MSYKYDGYGAKNHCVFWLKFKGYSCFVMFILALSGLFFATELRGAFFLSRFAFVSMPSRSI